MLVHVTLAAVHTSTGIVGTLSAEGPARRVTLDGEGPNHTYGYTGRTGRALDLLAPQVLEFARSLYPGKVVHLHGWSRPNLGVPAVDLPDLVAARYDVEVSDVV